MYLNLAVSATICVSLVNGLAHNAPRATGVDQPCDEQGWTPAPTSAPQIPQELFRRGIEGRAELTTVMVASDNTCGYLSGNAGAPYTCGSTATCNFFPAVAGGLYGAVGCCDRTDCQVALSCINSQQYYSSSICNDVCDANTFVLKCTNSLRPYCNTAFFATPAVEDYYCHSKAATTIQTFAVTYPGQTLGGSLSPLVLTPSETSSTKSTSKSSTTTIISSTSTLPPGSISIPSPSPSPDPIPTPTPKPSTPVGAIVGGVIGGIALIALIAFGIFIIRRRNRKERPQSQPPNYNAYPPPQGTQEIGGGMAMKPEGGMQASQQPYYPPQDNMQQQQLPQQQQYIPSPPVPVSGYYNQGMKPEGGNPPVDRMSTVSPTSEQHSPAPVYNETFPSGVHEVAGRPIG